MGTGCGCYEPTEEELKKDADDKIGREFKIEIRGRFTDVAGGNVDYNTECELHHIRPDEAIIVLLKQTLRFSD